MKKFALSILIALSISTTGCITHTTLPDSQRPSDWASPINKTLNLHQITPNLYRSSQPYPSDVAQLTSLGIDTIINLRPEQDDDKALANMGLTVVAVPIDTWKINKHDVLATMKAINTAQSQGDKVLIHCYHGADRTGIMSAMYRVLYQNWTIDEARAEMKYGGYGYHPIWINVDRLLNEQTVNWLKQELDLTTPTHP